MIPKGTTFELPNKNFKCSPAGENDGNDLIVCTGTPLFAFDIKLCNQEILPDLVMGSDRCEAGGGYDKANQCCIADPAEVGCVIFKTETFGC